MTNLFTAILTTAFLFFIVFAFLRFIERTIKNAVYDTFDKEMDRLEVAATKMRAAMVQEADTLIKQAQDKAAEILLDALETKAGQKTPAERLN